MSSTFAFDFSYEFRLVEGHRLELCRHMLGIYNGNFTAPWRERIPANAKAQSEEFWETRYSRYPTSPEFDAVRWLVHPYKVHGKPHSALFSEFDFDNDGQDELVIHVGFFNGSPGSSDYFWLFAPGSIELRGFHTHSDFLERIAPKRKAVIGYPFHHRYKGRTYLHGYVWTPRKAPGSNPAEPFASPEYLLINEYAGSPAHRGESRPMTLVCKYEMIQQR